MDVFRPNTAIKRDPRIDFFRGVSLFMILFDHVIDDPIGSFVTFRHFGLSDAAEIFVFLSGISCGIVYSRILSREGWAGLLAATIKRSAYIYVFCIVTSMATIVLIAAANSLEYLSPYYPDTGLPRLPPSGVVPWILSSLSLTSPPEYAGILILYILLTTFVVPLFLAAAQFNLWLPLVISGFGWLLTQFYPGLSPALPKESFFPLLSWQFLFAIGMFVGLKYWCQGTPSELPKSGFLLKTAFLILALGFIYKVVRHAALEYQVAVEWFPSREEFQNLKEQLWLPRLAHFLSVAYLVAIYIKDKNPFFSSPVAQAIIQTGKHSLEVFCLCAFLSVLLNIVGALFRPDVVARLILDSGAVVIVLLAVTALSNARKRTGQYSLTRS